MVWETGEKIVMVKLVKQWNSGLSTVLNDSYALYIHNAQWCL